MVNYKKEGWNFSTPSNFNTQTMLEKIKFRFVVAVFLIFITSIFFFLGKAWLIAAFIGLIGLMVGIMIYLSENPNGSLHDFIFEDI